MADRNLEVERIVAPYRVARGDPFRLAKFDPDDSGDFDSKRKVVAQQQFHEGVELLAELQQKLYAQDHFALLVILQAMDAAGKDGTINHVMSGVNPQGCQVYSFKAPSVEELDHDWMWRTSRCLPERGRIGIFNRSYYEEVLVVRVHPELLERQHLPPRLVTKRIWSERCQDIRAFERYLHRNGIVVLKFFLNVSREEQRRRFLERLEEPEKIWKFAPTDVAERNHWKSYMAAYEDAIRETATRHAPWYVVPADKKWYTRLVVVSAIIDALQRMQLRYPTIDARRRRELAAIRRLLLRERR